MKKRAHEPGRARNPDKAGATDTDAELFERHMAGVTRIAPDPRGRVRAAPVSAARHAPAPPAHSPTSLSDDDGLDGGFVAPGVDRRELRKLKRGEYGAGPRLDLHGHTAAEAVERVTVFLERARRTHRAVCIVHGRGLHSAGNVAVLKQCVRACLRRHRAVLAYSDALPADGGPGAVYVLLRK